jgi:hypothetical protein
LSGGTRLRGRGRWPRRTCSRRAGAGAFAWRGRRTRRARRSSFSQSCPVLEPSTQNTAIFPHKIY